MTKNFYPFWCKQLTIALLGLLLSLGIHTLTPVMAQSVAPNPGLALMQAGNKHYDAGQFLEASQIWRQAAQGYEQAGDRTHQALALSFVSLGTQQLGEWPQAQAAIDTSLSLLANTDKVSTRVRAQVLNALGHRTQSLLRC